MMKTNTEVLKLTQDTAKSVVKRLAAENQWGLKLSRESLRDLREDIPPKSKSWLEKRQPRIELTASYSSPSSKDGYANVRIHIGIGHVWYKQRGRNWGDATRKDKKTGNLIGKYAVRVWLSAAAGRLNTMEHKQFLLLQGKVSEFAEQLRKEFETEFEYLHTSAPEALKTATEKKLHCLANQLRKGMMVHAVRRFPKTLFRGIPTGTFTVAYENKRYVKQIYEVVVPKAQKVSRYRGGACDASVMIKRLS